MKSSPPYYVQICLNIDDSRIWLKALQQHDPAAGPCTDLASFYWVGKRKLLPGGGQWAPFKSVELAVQALILLFWLYVLKFWGPWPAMLGKPISDQELSACSFRVEGTFCLYMCADREEAWSEMYLWQLDLTSFFIFSYLELCFLHTCCILVCLADVG